MSGKHQHRDQQLRLQREAAERQDLVGQLIEAVSEAQHARASTPWPELAARAYEKLQYDLPLVDVGELHALLHAFR